MMKSVCLIAIAGILAFAEVADSRPNIVVVLVDDLRWDEISCAGHPVVRTPHIDRIATEGVRFRNAFATTPLCSPSRASFLTGQYPHRHGITDNTDRSAQSHRMVTFPGKLQEAGYETAYIGKWHMGNDNSRRPGFDYWACLKGQGTSRDPIMDEDGERVELKGYTTDILNQKAVEFIGRDREKPFCLYIAHKALHPELVQYDDGSISDPGAARFIPAERHEKLYAEAPVPRRLNVTDTLEGKPALQREIEGLPALSRATGTKDEKIRDRWRMLAAVDDGIGMLLERLEKGDALDETVFVFTSDHGYWYGEHGLSVERRLPYEEAARIPLLIRYPKVAAAGGLVDRIALSIDVAPTLLELAGVEGGGLDGRSLVPLLAGDETDDWRKSFLIEYYTDTVFPRVHKMGYKAIRTERFKYIRYVDLEGMDELYDLWADPYEVRNVIGEPESQKVLEELKAELKRLLSGAAR